MVTILSNVNALAASRQLGISKIGLNQAITRLTTGRRVNNASDDAASLEKGNTAMAESRSAAASVYAKQADYFKALADDGTNQQYTDMAYKLAELEGGGNSTSTEYTDALDVLGSAFTTAVTNSTTALSAIRDSQASNAAAMATALTAANTQGIIAETKAGIADAYLGADIGAEMANLTKYQIMMQAGTSALSSANQAAQTVLGLFR